MKSVVLIYRAKTLSGWRRYPAVFSKNGRVKPRTVSIAGRETVFEQGKYEVRTYEDGKPHYQDAGQSASDALALRDRVSRQASVRASAVAAGVQLAPVQEQRPTFAAAAKKYEEDARARGAMEAVRISHLVAGEFQESWRGLYVDEIRRGDVLAFQGWLKKRGNVARTIANKHARLKSILLFSGFDKTVMPPAPRYESKLPTIYEPEDRAALLRSVEGRMYLVCSVALKLGLREQEIAHMGWGDVNKRERVHRVRSKSEWGFKVKDSEERDVPIPDDLFTELEAWSVEHAGPLLFPTPAGKPDGHLLRRLKAVARDAGLNCGACAGCRRSGECREWTLHKFRRSYLTWLLRHGIDLRTAQMYAGHADLASTMRYLRPASGPEARAKVNAIPWH